jgi:hypothetical protein
VEKGKIGLAELVILSIIGLLVYVIVERGHRTVEPDTEVETVPEPEKTPAVQTAPLPPPQIEPMVPAAPHPAPTLDDVAIKVGIDGVSLTVEACAQLVADKCPTVKLHIGVAPDGTVTFADVESASNARVGKCVATAVRKATFQVTEQGGDFEYPFTFGCEN